MRKFIISLVVGMMAVAMVGGVASAAGHAPGKAIQDECGYTYGAAVSVGKQAARAGLHPDFTPSGAAAFAESVIGTAPHCPAD